MTTIALAGNPNCGKSALFNRLTGVRQRTGNWPGVTVDRKEGKAFIDGRDVLVIDLPGIYSMDATSLDEQITMEYLLSGEADLVINILDASNLERNLYLTMQLLEMGLRMVIAVNMMDVARRRGMELDLKMLADRLHCPVVSLVAVTGEGLQQLKQAVAAQLDAAAGSGFQIVHDDLIEQAIADIRDTLPDGQNTSNHRWHALKMLESVADETGAADALPSKVRDWQQAIVDRSGDEADVHIADARFNHAHVIAGQVIRRRGQAGRTLTDVIDRLMLHRYLGIPVFLAVMYLMFMFTINFGGAFIDFFDGVTGAFTVDGSRYLLERAGMPEWTVVLLADGVGGGLRVLATFIPIITCLYLFLSVLEDTGYMARAAFVMDRFMRSIGLPGKAFVPLIVGFGCNVPAVLATRTLDNPRERKLTILMNPFMSCGARLPVYVLFAAAFFPDSGQNLVFALYLTGIVVAILTGLVMKQTLLSGASTGFLMELPAYHLPTIRGVLLRTWDRVRSFLVEAGRIIIVMVVVLNLFNSLGSDGSFGNENSDKSLLSGFARQLTPVFAPLGIEQDNWPAVVGILTGVLAKEVVVGTLDSLYSRMARQEAGMDTASREFDLTAQLTDALASIPLNLKSLGDRLLDPLDIRSIDAPMQDASARNQAVDGSVFGAMINHYDGKHGAFAYLLFILLYFPCVATIGAIARETSKSWAAFVAAWTTGVAYLVSSGYYQLASWHAHPLFSGLWLLITLLVAVGVVGILRIWGRRQPLAASSGLEA